MKITRGEDGLTYFITSEGFSYSDFNKADKVDLWRIAKHYELGRAVLIRCALRRDFQITSDVSFFARYQTLEILPEFYTTADVIFPWCMEVQVGYVGKTSFVVNSKTYCRGTGTLLAQSSGHAVRVSRATRRPVDLPAAGVAKYRPLVSKNPALEFSVPNITPCKEQLFTYTTKALPSDTDSNDHVNQSACCRYCYDCASLAAVKGPWYIISTLHELSPLETLKFVPRQSLVTMGASSSTSLVQDNGLPFFSDDPHLKILMEEMSLRNINRREIESRFSTRTVKGHGFAECPSCSRQWSSHQASAEIDLKNPNIRVWKQKCLSCHEIVDMTFKEREFRRMINNMLDRLERQMKGERDLSNHDDATTGSGPPHRKELCEGCQWGAGDCRTSTVGLSGGAPRHTNRQTAVVAAGGGGTPGRSGGMNNDGDDENWGLKLTGGVALGAGLLALGGLAAYAFGQSYGDEEEQKKKKEKR